MNKTNVTKETVESYWNREACGTHFADAEKFTTEYFNQIEEKRYQLEPYIHSFAQFTRWHGKKVLEVGVGAGTDFVQWVRAGALAHGVDLTSEAIVHTKRRLEQEDISAVDLRQSDAESLDYPDNSFDLVYSWGVIHHSPDPFIALKEIVRVAKPGGKVKLMVYHRYSVAAFMTWLRYCIMRGRPYQSISFAIANYVESIGTRAYTRGEIFSMLYRLPLENLSVRTVLTWCDLASSSRSLAVRTVHRLLSWIGGGDRVGWFMLIEANKRV
ncbi:MAG: class I SAM-dependent methyltransferase [Candidatus Scalindua sp.]